MTFLFGVGKTVYNSLASSVMPRIEMSRILYIKAKQRDPSAQDGHYVRDYASPLLVEEVFSIIQWDEVGTVAQTNQLIVILGQVADETLKTESSASITNHLKCVWQPTFDRFKKSHPSTKCRSTRK